MGWPGMVWAYSYWGLTPTGGLGLGRSLIDLSCLHGVLFCFRRSQSAGEVGAFGVLGMARTTLGRETELHVEGPGVYLAWEIMVFTFAFLLLTTWYLLIRDCIHRYTLS